MKFTVATIISSALLSTSLASPRPDAEADPGYRVVKTVQIWDDEEKDATMPGFEEIDLIPGVFEDEIYEDADLDIDLTPELEDQILKENEIAPQIFKAAQDNATFVDDNGRTCRKKLMLTEYTDYTEVMTCVHKSKERCHTTYVTNFEPHQEQKCDEKFEKRCTIHYEDVAQNDEVEVCKTSICPDCSEQGEEECSTVYDTVCETKRNAHNVTDDVVNCETVYEEGNCKNVTNGEYAELNFIKQSNTSSLNTNSKNSVRCQVKFKC